MPVVGGRGRAARRMGPGRGRRRGCRSSGRRRGGGGGGGEEGGEADRKEGGGGGGAGEEGEGKPRVGDEPDRGWGVARLGRVEGAEPVDVAGNPPAFADRLRQAGELVLEQDDVG